MDAGAGDRGHARLPHGWDGLLSNQGNCTHRQESLQRLRVSALIGSQSASVMCSRIGFGFAECCISSFQRISLKRSTAHLAPRGLYADLLNPDDVDLGTLSTGTTFTVRTDLLNSDDVIVHRSRNFVYWATFPLPAFFFFCLLSSRFPPFPSIFL